MAHTPTPTHGLDRSADSLSPAEAVILLRGINVGASALARDILSGDPVSVSLALTAATDGDPDLATTQDPAAAWHLQLRTPEGLVAKWHTGVPGPGAGGPSTQALRNAGLQQ